MKWLLLLYIWSGDAPVTVIELKSKADCLRVANIHIKVPRYSADGDIKIGTARCIPVSK
jgi:hypothetical protein